jgi:hypothetical protein
MKIYTCAMMPFVANEAFFTRDSGLLCRSLRELGIESKVAMPALESNELSEPDEIIRAAENEFTNSEWWGSLGIDAVVFITWGFKQHTPAICAAREAGIRTCAIFETGGESYPYFDFIESIKTHWRKGNQAEPFIKSCIGTFVRSLIFGFKGISHVYHRTVQIGVPHYAAFDTPNGMARCQQAVDFFKSIPQSSEKILTGYPIPDFFAPQPKEKRQTKIVAIGRWDAIRHKRPNVLMKTIEQVLPMHLDVVFEIFGFLPEMVKSWHLSLKPEHRERVKLSGMQPSLRISEALGESQILYCPSASDGIPLCVVEALCGGCSVVGLKTKDVAGLFWAVSEGDGTFAVDDSIKSHTAAVLGELDAWKHNARNPLEISERWKKWFSAKQVAERLIGLLSQPQHQ